MIARHSAAAISYDLAEVTLPRNRATARRRSVGEASGTVPLAALERAVRHPAGGDVISFPTAAIPDRRFLQRRDRCHRSRAYEAIAAIAINVLLSGVALVTLVKLLPYQTSQQEKLNEISTELQYMTQRVETLQAALLKTFDSGRSQELRLREQGWFKRNQYSVILVEPNARSESETLPLQAPTAQRPDRSATTAAIPPGGTP